MIGSIDIKSYKNLDGLRINSLATINLFAGKNNTGKSALLEAIALLVTDIDMNMLVPILENRGESFKNLNTNENILEYFKKAFSSLFTDRLVGFRESDAIVICEANRSNENYNIAQKSVSMRFVKYYYDEIVNPNSVIQRGKLNILDDESESTVVDYKIGLEVRVGQNRSVWPFEDRNMFHLPVVSRGKSSENVQYIKTSGICREINGKLFDNIVFSDKEQSVINALKIIEPDIEKIAFVEQNSLNPKPRKPVIKVSGSDGHFPLLSMGDGINRIFDIIMALVNSENGYLLIDEIENGLHHTVQEKLWDIIFKLSGELNVQVFATTHSEDCISGLQSALSVAGNAKAGKFMRLDNINGKIQVVEYTNDELKIASDHNIETR